MKNPLSTILPYRFTFRDGLVNTVLAAPLRRARLRNELAQQTEGMDDSVTVLIGIRNRSDYRLRNALWSLRHQDYPSDLVKIVVVDYGSTTEHRTRTFELCDRFDAECFPLAAPGGWNKPKCLNYAIKRTRTKFLLSSDVDVIFPQQYLTEMVHALKKNPLAAVYSRMQDLPQDSVETMQTLDTMDADIPFDTLFELASARGAGYENAGINGTYTHYYHYLRGYDEFYEGWGSEDNDLMKRFVNLGLDIVSLYPNATYLHQWHPKGEGIGNYQETARRNREYYEDTRSIIRNTQRWGESD
jgi:hypothetical protein